MNHLVKDRLQDMRLSKGNATFFAEFFSLVAYRKRKFDIKQHFVRENVADNLISIFLQLQLETKNVWSKYLHF